jgi:hypothetical protein
LLDGFTVGGVLGMHLEPPALVLASRPECGLKRRIVKLS